MREVLRQAHRIIVKVGTRVCLRPDGKLNGEVLVPLAQQIARLRSEGRQVVLVTSGAVGMGRALLSAGDDLPAKQALAALGQVELMNAWKSIFGLLHVHVAQVLLTRDDLGARERYLNARHTLLGLLRHGILPVVNENDSVATDEIRFGDNDSLSAMVGALLDANAVFNLTSAPGILGADDRVVPLITEIDASVEALDRGTTTSGGTGGLASKLEAARIAMRYGGTMAIASAAEPEVLLRLVAGEELGTLFAPSSGRLRSRKRWLAMGGRTRGSVVVDAGAVQALVGRGRSLLPVGVVRVEGRFGTGDLVSLCGPDGREIGRGLTNYGAEDVLRLLGQPSARIREILGYEGYEEIVHRDNLVIAEG